MTSSAYTLVIHSMRTTTDNRDWNSGDGRADILCIEKNGRVTAWLNKASGLVDVGQIKFSEGWDRANIRFADVEHTGRVDLLHLDKYTGQVTVFRNLGHKPGGRGSSFSWYNAGVLYSGVDRGANLVCLAFILLWSYH